MPDCKSEFYNPGRPSYPSLPTIALRYFARRGVTSTEPRFMQTKPTVQGTETNLFVPAPRSTH